MRRADGERSARRCGRSSGIRQYAAASLQCKRRGTADEPARRDRDLGGSDRQPGALGSLLHSDAAIAISSGPPRSLPRPAAPGHRQEWAFAAVTADSGCEDILNLEFLPEVEEALKAAMDLDPR